VSAFIARAQASGKDWPWLEKVDPAASLLLSIWIVYGWATNALEQVHLLSDRRSEDIDDAVVSEAASRALQGQPVRVVHADVYHVGEGCRARLVLCPEPGQSAADHIAKLASALQNMEGAVRDAATGIADVETYFRAEDIKK